ncbi:MAG: hydrogenase 2 small subunit [Nitrospirae bacterium CG_4_9_14_3_um_filter_53_35]|nr:MAG: hydrogenase 2 small subunit [Nitrospirae bacterium CG2_30_53_67]PIS36305.1 MAG: hydrogenase 2 small subunit [Nitrospirae bacterium CG08_land_8_20_14_0_20_52_24]PIV85431.1 MAG: hydrogenase 2 small subunit [Nitrospirae bacterium CG17_big_fil_post_rev_8_21_14_2_50_50_9]PIW85067.1 MAG: hydrogenase 2 small subunit [Nitrospirae bacterium CG_4_8_14_3_um_filter_50_41]PIX85527.1 MAG: hydrogenase 2 small subunit [Nitrospirae bacterium CG_4_10_14_3_um_filter_53_41]PJA72771.1 MAG: hydrogenase 2 sm
MKSPNFFDDLSRSGFSRREFLKLCTAAAVYMGLPAGMGARIAEAVAGPKRPTVIWLSGQACTGCVESLLRPNHPTLEHLILDVISLDYLETLSTGAGHQAEEYRKKSVEENKGRFILVVDGSVPIKDGGIYCKIGGETMVDLVTEMGSQAMAVIAIGSCASWGGIPSAHPNPTGATPVYQVLKYKGIETPVVNVPGCPPNGYNFLSTVLHFLTFQKLPEVDDKLRPKFAYGRLIHENCERRPHFDAGRYAEAFGDEGHRKGWCLYKLGCKGPETYNNCPAILFGDVGSGAWPVGTGHPCFGCSEGGVGFNVPLHTMARLNFWTTPAFYPHIFERRGEGLSLAEGAVIVAVGGAAIGAGAMIARNLGKHEGQEGEKTSEDTES